MVTAAERFRSRLREWRDSGSEIQITSKRSFHAKYMWLMCARPPGDTVDSEQRGEAFINLRATRSSVADENRRDLRSTVTPIFWRPIPHPGVSRAPSGTEFRTSGVSRALHPAPFAFHAKIGCGGSTRQLQRR